jgi:CheY-like chemotaxis protein
MERLRAIDILLAEDNIGDIRLTEEAIKESKLKINLHIVMDGEEAMAYLRKSHQYINEPTPDLILLDLNMPKKDGREVLKEVKEDIKLKHIPVAILTMSKAEEDILQAYDQYVNCYISKPLDLDRFVDVVKCIDHFWFSIVTLPERN